MTFVPSPQQATIFDFIKNGSGNANIIAVAGAGKTTTLIEGVNLMDGQVQIGAFNKGIAAEISGKLTRKGIDWKKANAKTMHGLGNGAWRKAAKDCAPEPNEYKVLDIFKSLTAEKPGYARYQTFVLKLVSLAKQAGVGIIDRKEIDDSDRWMSIVEHFNVDDDLQDGSVDIGIELARQCFKKSAELCSAVIDFDDMIFAPLFHDARFWQTDWFLLDEAQDTNFCRRLIAERCLKRNGRLIAVGDPRQAIYGFTGADNDAMELIAQSFNCQELPLTVTYRCPKAVVRHAQQYVSHIHAHESAPEGELNIISEDAWRGRLGGLQPTDAIICRYNAPIVQTAFELIRMGIPCKIEGREIGKGLISLARKWKSVQSVADLDVALSQYLHHERQKAVGKQGGEAKVAALADKVATLKVLMEQLARDASINELVRNITNLFGDEVKDMVVLSTIHKAKGREWNRVFQLGNEPAFFAKQDWEVMQEQNLLYVAATRAQQALTIVEFDKDVQRRAA